MTKRLAFTVNVDKCIGCSACEMACKNVNALDPEICWRKLYHVQEDAFGAPTRMYMSLSCNHCEDPACLKVCPTKAYEILEDGVVLHHPDKCIGCTMCVMACPYNVPQYNERTKVVGKCHMCHERMANGLQPACVNSCPVRAIQVVDLNEEKNPNYKDTMPGFPEPAITKSTTQFIKQSSIKRVIPKSSI